MFIEFARVLIGLNIALFHGPLADFFRRQDRALSEAFHERGVPFPGALPKRAAHDLFFVLGVLVALVSLARIWMTMR